MGFFSYLRKWFTDKTGFTRSKESLKRKHDKCETVNNKRARMDDSLVEVVEISDESLSEAEEVEITEPGPSTMPLRASPPVMLIDGRHDQRRTLSPTITVDLTETSNNESEMKFMKSFSLSDSKIISNRTSSLVRSVSSKSCLFDPMKFEDKYSQKLPTKGTIKSSLSMEDRISALHVGSDSSINNSKDHSFAMILKNYVLPKSDDINSKLSDTSHRKLLSNGSIDNNTENSFFKNYVRSKLGDIDSKGSVMTPQSVSNNEIKESVLNQSYSSQTLGKQKLDVLRLPKTYSVGSSKNFNESVLNQSNSSRTSDKENLDIPGLSINKSRVIQNEMFYERILRRFREKQATAILNPISITQKSPDEIFQEKFENIRNELEKLQPSKKIDVFPGYSQEIVNLIDRKMAGPPSEYIVQGKNITRNDLRTVYSPSAWLNDEVINHYLHLIVDREPKSLHTFDTFFYTKLSSHGYEAVRRWSRKKDIFSCKKMFSPIHLGNHWCLTCVNFIEKSVTYYDSLGGKNPKCLNLIFDYLKQEHLNKKKEELNISGWRLVEASNCPKQGNGYDCGVFTCINAEYLARDAKLDFTQDDMPKLRKRICYEILNNKLCF